MARFPKINLDITHRCTLQCQRCNRAIFASRGIKVPGEDMTMENFKKVIDSFEDYKMWYEEDFVELADKLYEKKIFDYVYLICGKEKSYLARNIKELSKKEYFIDCSNKNLNGIIFALKNSNFLVGNNSGPINLAAALNVKSFGLIANDPVDELKYSKIQIITPENYNNIRCREREGMKKLKVERVFNKILEGLN